MGGVLKIIIGCTTNRTMGDSSTSLLMPQRDCTGSGLRSHIQNPRASFSKNPPFCCVWKNRVGSYLSAIFFSLWRFCAPYDERGSWSLAESSIGMCEISRPRACASSCQQAVVSMATDRTRSSSAASIQSTSVVHPVHY